jgi:maleylacetate reductase
MASRVFLMVSGTLNRQTDEVEKIRRALGNKCVGTFDKMPAALAALGGHRRGGAGARGQGRPDRHPGRRLDHRRRQGRPALPRQRHHHGRGYGQDPQRVDVKPPTVRQVSIPTTLSAGEFSGIAGVTNEAPR